MGIKVSDVFSTSRLPKYTYVHRSYRPGLTYEQFLTELISDNDKIISISGPTKCGKTTLVKQVVKPHRLVRIHGANVSSADKLWELVMARLETPIPSQITQTDESEDEYGAEGSVGAPAWWATLAAKLSLKHKTKDSTAIKYDKRQSDHQSAIRELQARKCVLVIDDFHYIDAEVQKEICRQIKGDLESELGHPPIIVCSIPSKEDSTTRALNELQGRVQSVKFELWQSAELLGIATQGFEKLGRPLKDSQLVMEKLVPETLGSPHVMQDCCKTICRGRGIFEGAGFWRKEPVELADGDIKDALREVAGSLNYERTYNLLEAGVPTKGQPRIIHSLNDGMEEGDVYQVLLRAIALDPPKIQILRDELNERIARVVKGPAPHPSSIGSVLGKLDRLVLDKNPKNMVLEWDEGARELIIRDPLFLFYLRHGDK